MSERDNITLDNSATSESELQAIQERIKLKNEAKARLVSVLSRGLTLDRLHVDLPDDLYGEWVPDDKAEIYRMEALGFKVDTEYASKRALHEGGSGPAKVADAVYMVAPRYVKEAIDEIRLENYIAANSPRSGKQKEERDFANEAQATGLPSEIKSRVDSATADQIRSAITAKD